jgi:non-homologous end joining protein Ku
MTAYELYEALDKADIDFEIVEIEEGLRVISIMVDEVSNEELTKEMIDEDPKQIEIDNLKAELKYFYGGGK